MVAGEDVNYVSDNGLANGVGTGSRLTRGMLVTILYRQVGSPLSRRRSPPSSDCEEDSWYVPVWAVGTVSFMAMRGYVHQQGHHPSGNGEGVGGHDKTIGKRWNEAATELTSTLTLPIADWAPEGVHYCTAAIPFWAWNNAFNPNGTARPARHGRTGLLIAAA